VNFSEKIHNVIVDPRVRGIVTNTLKAGQSDVLFNDYFGFNFDKNDLVSVKLYFAFLTITPPENIYSIFNINDEIKKLIKNNWSTSQSISYLHQGVTLGLKCYLSGDNVKVNTYIYFRPINPIIGEPRSIKLQSSDLVHKRGYCVEIDSDGCTHQKNYFYIYSDQCKQQIFQDFELQKYGLLENDISFVEYTESEFERKINIILTSADKVGEFVEKCGNRSIIQYSERLYRKHKLYFFAPGVRLGSSVIALYFVPKDVYSGKGYINSIRELYAENKISLVV